MKKILLVLIFMLTIGFTLASCEINNESSDKPVDPVEPTIDEIIDGIISSMTLEDKVCQMITIAYRTENSSPVTTLTTRLESLLNRYAFGGFIVYAENIQNNKQAYDFMASIQNAANLEGRPGLFISVDQEGGRVVRLSEGTTMPGNMGLGAINDLNVTTEVARIIGEEIIDLGMNTTFAPVVDVNNNPNNPVIGARSFGDDPNDVSLQAKAFIEGLKQAGAIGCLKHFPGHGDTDTDSHTGLPLINKTLDELKQNELIPYIDNIKDIEMIMTAHIVYPQIEKDTYVSKLTGEEINLPATLSKTIMTDILRDDLGFEGVVVTDALNMDAIEKHFTKSDSARLAINAGVDMLLWPINLSTSSGITNMENYIADIINQVESGAISLDRINESVKRILKLKANHGLLEGSAMPDEALLSNVGSTEHHDIEMQAALKAITLVKNDGALPLNNKKVLIVAPDTSLNLSLNYGLGLAEASADIKKIDDITTSNASSVFSNYDNIIFISKMANKSYFSGSAAKKIYDLINIVNNLGKKSIVLSINLPYDAALFTNADAFVICYSDKGMSEDPRVSVDYVKQYGPNIPAAIYLMFKAGDGIKFTGTLPVEIRKLDSSYKFTNEILYERRYGLGVK